jgi:hypothetical protein
MVQIYSYIRIERHIILVEANSSDVEISDVLPRILSYRA